MSTRRVRRLFAIRSPLVAFAVLAATLPAAAQDVTSPEDFLGFQIGADHRLASYSQLQSYWTRLAAESPRIALQDIGKTAEGRPQLMAIVTSPENQTRLEHYRDISRRLAPAEGTLRG